MSKKKKKPKSILVLWRGSPKDDFPVVPKIKGLEVVEITISAHKQPTFAIEKLAELYKTYPKGFVIIAVVGMSNGLGPTLAANTFNPVINFANSVDKHPEDIWSNVRLPSNVPAATITNGNNAVLFALNTLSLSNKYIRKYRRTEVFKIINEIYKGKVGILYDGRSLGFPMLIQRSSALSGLNKKLSSTIPTKGMILSQLSQWWMQGPLKDVIENHLVKVPKTFFEDNYISSMKSTTAVVKRLNTEKVVECIVRNSLDGEGWKEYEKFGKIFGIKLPKGMKKGDRLPKPIFSPTYKNENDDMFKSFKEFSDYVGKKHAKQLRKVSFKINKIFIKTLSPLNIHIADFKAEFGIDENGNLVLMDEIGTPDTCRFWDKKIYDKTGKIVSRDKQKIRDELVRLKESGEWDGESPIYLSDTLMKEVEQDYIDIFKAITGKKPVLT